MRLLSGILVAVAFAFFQDVDVAAETDDHKSLLSLFLFGGWAFVVGSLPVWLTSKQLSGSGRWDDRFALSIMLGAVLMTLAAILWLIRAQQRKLRAHHTPFAFHRDPGAARQ